MWRFTDYFFRQSVEENGFRYGKINTVFHVHNETERIQYNSDDEKNFQKIVWRKPEYIIIDKNKEKKANIKHAKAIVKYLNPENPGIQDSKNLRKFIKILDRNWIETNGKQWLEVYDESIINYSWKRIIKKYLKKIK
jgi:hypothetical protein